MLIPDVKPMRVETDQGKYSIRFQYQTLPHLLHMNRSIAHELGIELNSKNKGMMIGVARRITVCKIVELGEDDVMYEVAEGRAICNPVENFVKNEGRARSLKRAIDGLPPELLPHSKAFIDAYAFRHTA